MVQTSINAPSVNALSRNTQKTNTSIIIISGGLVLLLKVDDARREEVYAPGGARGDGPPLRWVEASQALGAFACITAAWMALTWRFPARNLELFCNVLLICSLNKYSWKNYNSKQNMNQ